MIVSMNFPRSGKSGKCARHFFVAVLMLISAVAGQASPSTSSPTSIHTFDLSRVKPLQPYGGDIKSFILRYLPSRLTPSADANAIASEIQNKVGQKIGEDLLKGELFRGKGMGHFLTNLSHAASTSLALSPKKEGKPSPFNVELVAYRAEAVIKYSGPVESSLSVVGQDQNVRLDLAKEVCPRARLALHCEVPLAQFAPSSDLSLSYSF